MPDSRSRFSIAITALFCTASVWLLGGCAAIQPLDYLQEVGIIPNSGSSSALENPAPSVATGQLSRPGPLLVVFTYGFGCPGDGWGNGLRRVADTIRQRFPSQKVITRGWNDDDHIVQYINNHPGPVLLVGHSYGGCRTVEITKRAQRKIDWVVLLDPVPIFDWSTPRPGDYFRIPGNVQSPVCYLRNSTWAPISYPIVNRGEPGVNRVRELGHSGFCRSEEIHQCIMEICSQAEQMERSYASVR